MVHYRFGTGDIVAKTDATLGLKPRDDLKVFIQLQSGRYPDSEPYLRAVPSLAWEFSPGRHVEVGIPVGISGDDRIGLKIGGWVEF